MSLELLEHQVYDEMELTVPDTAELAEQLVDEEEAFNGLVERLNGMPESTADDLNDIKAWKASGSSDSKCEPL